MKQVYKVILPLFASGFLSAQTTFNYTGAVQTYTVPACVSSITIDMYGASGGNNNSILGGLGGRVQATIPVTPGEVLQIYIGQTGANTQGSHPGVYNGGGGVYSYSSGGTAGTGGGASDIRRSPYSSADRIAVAGGGGGGGYQQPGGHGGGLVGQNGTPFPSWPNSGGGGGTQSSGGPQGVACCSCPTYTTAGSLAQGGNGAGDGAGGGGGGGGYYGGGGSCFAGGGGGSSYTDPAATGVTHTQGVRTGNGTLTITTNQVALLAPTGLSGPSTACYNSTGTYTINQVAGATSYNWTVPAGTTINFGQGTTSINVTYGLNSGNISVNAVDGCGSGPAVNQPVFINMLPIEPFGAPITGCSSAMLDGLNAGDSHLWSTSETTQTITVTASGNYTVIITNTFGCTLVDTANVTINPLPVVSLGPDVTQCGGNTTLDAGNAGATFMWSDSSTAQTLTTSSSGTFAVVVTNSFGCSNSDTVNVTINATPSVTASAANILPCSTDAPVALIGNPSGGLWTGPGVSGNAFNPGAVAPGTYNLTYTYTDSASGCQDTAMVAITVDICLGVNTPAQGQINVFPNPASDDIQIQSSTGITTYEIVDVTGRVVLSGHLNGAVNSRVDVSTLSAGTYILKTKDVSSNVGTFTFTKQ